MDIEDILVSIGTKFSKCPNKYVLRCHDLWLNFDELEIKNLIK